MKTFVFLGTFALFIIGCEPVIDSRGHNPDAMDLSKITTLKSSKDDVQAILGSPSVKGEMNGFDIWYYIFKKTETTSFFKPKIMEEKVLRITFNKKNRVKKKELLSGIKGIDLEPDADRTESTGYEEGLAGSILDDFNRKFNSSKKQKAETQ